MTKPESFQQKDKGVMTYPGSGWRRLMFRAPLLWWRLGLGLLFRPFFLVLTTKGRKSGRERHTMLEYSIVNGRIYIAPGWGERTQWYQNILADRRVTVQIGGRTIVADAVRVDDEKELAETYRAVRGKSFVWTQWLESWDVRDELDDYLAKKDRIPTLRLDEVQGAGPQPLGADWIWVWPVALAVAATVWFVSTHGR